LKKFLHIGFGFQAPPRTDELEPIFDKALDWMRYAPNCWIVQTTSTPQQWLARLRPLLSPSDNVFIVEINPANRSGWLPQSIWTWIKERTE
jgi:hypothetical protein